MDDNIIKEKLQRAVDFVKQGRRDEADSIFNELISSNPKVSSVWYVKGRLAASKKELLLSIRKLQDLAVFDTQARDQLAQLEKRVAPKETRESFLSNNLVFIGVAALLLLIICVGLTSPMFWGQEEAAPVYGTPELPDPTEIPQLTCEEIIEIALLASDQGCQQIGSNQLCYGNTQLDAVLVEEIGQFSALGDIIPIENLSQLTASPLNIELNEWGIAVFKLQANMPGTVPGQNVTFVAFGDTDLTNESGDMYGFYFSTGFGGVNCNQVDFNGLMVEMPDGTGIVFQANGVDIVLMGDAILQAQPGGEMTVNMITGTGIISSEGVTQTLEAGNSIEIPMNENLSPAGPPSEQQPMSETEIVMGCELYGVGCPPELAQDGNLATNTSVPGTPGMPTNTPVPLFPSPTTGSGFPTNTPYGNSTNTPIPGATNTTASCGSITVSAGGSPGSFTITNNYSSAIVINQITLSWPQGTNGNWRRSTLGNSTIYSEQITDSPGTVYPTASISQRTIARGSTDVLGLVFENAPESSGYSITIVFDVGCSRGASQ